MAPGAGRAQRALLFAIAILCVGGTLFKMLSADERMAQRAESGVPVTATVTEHRHTTSWHRRTGTTHHYSLMLEYEHDGQTHEQGYGVDEDIYDRVPDGAPFDILVGPGAPHLTRTQADLQGVSRHDWGRALTGSLLCGGCGSFLVYLPVLWLVAQLRRRRRRKARSSQS